MSDDSEIPVIRMMTWRGRILFEVDPEGRIYVYPKIGREDLAKVILELQHEMERAKHE